MSVRVAHIAFGLAVWNCLFTSLALFAAPPAEGVDQKESLLPQAGFYATMAKPLGVPRRNAAIQSAPQHGLLLVVDFPDMAFDSANTILSFDSMANSSSYNYNGSNGSIRQYFCDQSCGQFEPTFDVVGPIHLPHPMAHYGKQLSDERTDQYLGDFVIDACRLADDSMHVDFTRYDADGDSVVDFLYIIYAGYSQAEGGSSDCIWPHSWDLMSAIYFGYHTDTTYFIEVDTITSEILSYNLPLFDSVYVDSYACSNERHYYYNHERCGIGVFCHEFAHVLGLPDYYNTDNQSLADSTPGQWSLMANGCYNNRGKCPPNFSAFDKYFLGWVTPERLTDTTHLVLPADGETYAMFSPTYDLLADTAYFLENRQQFGWDTYLPSHGMLIWRVTYIDSLWMQNQVNANEANYLLLTADGLPPYSDRREKEQSYDAIPFPGSTMRQSIVLHGDYQLLNIFEQAEVVSLDVFAPSMPVNPDNEVHKYLRNGTILIEREGNIYTLLGGLVHHVNPVHAPSANHSQPIIHYERPQLKARRSEQVISHVGYSVSYNSEWHIPNWVAYQLTASEVGGEEERSNHFKPDPQVKGNPVVTSDYAHSGYDRGHMAPAADMKWSEQAMRESFYMTNICPQNHSNNAGDWKDLEEFVRDLAMRYDSIYIACGPIVENASCTIGTERKIVVPQAFYKVLLRRTETGNWTAIGFVMKNEAGNRPLMTYMHTIDEVEKMTGIDFFYLLPDSVEKQVEADYSIADWTL